MSLQALELLVSRASEKADQLQLQLVRQQQEDARMAEQLQTLRVAQLKPLPTVLSAQSLQLHAAQRQALGREELAVQSSRQTLQHAQAQTQLELRQVLLDKHKYGKLIERQLMQAAQRQVKREQKETDAVAAQAWMRNRQAMATAA